MTSLLALLVVSRQAGSITFFAPAAPFDRVCDQLAKQTGLAIALSGDLRDEVVAIDIHDMARQELIKRLSHVLYAKAAFKADKWELTHDLVAARKRQENALTSRILRISMGLLDNSISLTGWPRDRTRGPQS
jgi:hypothetical protein